MTIKNITGLILATLTLVSMALFSFFKKTATTPQTLSSPYKGNATNFIYNLLFCDYLELYKEKIQQPFSYPFDILFAETSSDAELQKIINAPDSEPRIKILAYNKLLASGQKPNKKNLLAVIVEVGLDDGLDVLA